VAAILGSVPGSVAGSENHRRVVRLGSVEPALLALLKHLEALFALVTLLICIAANHDRLTPGIGAASMLTLTLAGQVFGQSKRAHEIAGKPLSRVYSRILLEWFGIVSVLLLLAFAFKVSTDFSRAVMLSWFTVTPFALFLAHSLRNRANRAIANSAYAPRFIIIGANAVGYELFRRLPQKGFLGFFDFRSADRVAQVIDPEKLAGHCKDVADFARAHGVTAIYIALPLSNVPRIGAMVHALRDTTASIYFVPDVFAFDMIQARLVELNGLPAIAVCDTPFHGMDAVLKRATDLIVASTMLLMLSPLMLLIAIAVKLTSRGTVLFQQRRYGLNGEEIVVYKFRSMTVCEDGPVVTQAKKEGDKRVTRLGKFLRKTSLDELPQLLNVLQGRMSMVGPRPHAVAHNEEYRKKIHGYMIRHKVRPGITGLAQVNGFRGETDTEEKMRMRVKYDLEYLSSWSPWLDLKIILKTALVILRDPNAY
jgi:putative colanic acid biosynthesis UDP-glucose lipid carrier transferase